MLSRALTLVATALLLVCCHRDGPKPPDEGVVGAPAPVAPVPLFTCRSAGAGHPVAAAVHDTTAARSFDEFLQSVRRECVPGGKYLVDGDDAIADIKLLREFFDTRMAAAAGAPANPGADEPFPVWPASRKGSLTYCVSNAFGAQHDKVVADMEAATGAWEQVANVDFDHVAVQDAACGSANDDVLFDVNPVDIGGAYLARAFAPGEPRGGRNLYVDLAALAFDPAQELQLAGVLRHELGHVLGFRHASDEHSVMNYPQPGVSVGLKLLLSDRDSNAAACAYGAAPGFSINPALCDARPRPAPPPGAPIVKSFADQGVAPGALREYPAFTAKPGSLVRVSMRPHGDRSGDPDLYVRLGQKPQVRPAAFTCRPFLTGALETCEIDAGAAPNNLVRILVHGYTAGSYDLDVSFVPLTP